jgi:Transcriptional regulator
MGIYKEKREHTKNILINSFWDIYESKSIDKITVKEITDRAGYNRSTFYIHFKDINDILQCIEERLFEYLDEKFKHIDIESLDQEEWLKNTIVLLKLNSKYYRILLSPKGDPYFAEKHREKLKELFYSSIKNNRNIGENKAFVVEYLVGGLISSLMYWFEERPFSEEELFNNLFKMVTACIDL